MSKIKRNPFTNHGILLRESLSTLSPPLESYEMLWNSQQLSLKVYVIRDNCQNIYIYAE